MLDRVPVAQASWLISVQRHRRCHNDAGHGLAKVRQVRLDLLVVKEYEAKDNLPFVDFSSPGSSIPVPFYRPVSRDYAGYN